MCAEWKGINQQQGGAEYLDWCSYPGQVCSAEGTLLRLDMDGINLTCKLPAYEFLAFRDLETLKLGNNPGLTVRLHLRLGKDTSCHIAPQP